MDFSDLSLPLPFATHIADLNGTISTNELHHKALAALHDVNLAARYCSYILMLFGDGEWQAGPATELLTKENPERL